MAPLVLEGHTLGEKHRSFNKLVKERFVPNETAKEDDDIAELLKIERASKDRNVSYILEVLKSEDELHVSKAIKRSTWLITDPQYAHIINPEHLYTQLRPQMTTKAFNKLMLNVRLHLRDQQRVKEFYKYIEKDDTKLAFKWLQHCSVPLLEKEVVKHCYDIPNRLLLRLFEKSFTIFREYILKRSSLFSISIIDKNDFLTTKYTEQFLDFLKSLKQDFYFHFNPKGTKCVMKKFPEKIINDFEIYGKHLDMATFVKCLKDRENIEDFLLKHVSNEKLNWLYSHNNIQHFIYNLPKEKRFGFTRKLFMDKEFEEHQNNPSERDMLLSQCAMKFSSSGHFSERYNKFQWYKFAPFETAFADLKKLIRVEINPSTRITMMQVLVVSAGRNAQHIHTLLQYYHDKHINEPFKFKIQFVNYFISRVEPQSLDDKSWNVLNKLFHSMNVYTASENNVQSCIGFILVRSIIRKDKIPEIVKQKLVLDSLKHMRKKLNTHEETESVFQFLYNDIIEKYNMLHISEKESFDQAVLLCDLLLNLIKDWNRELDTYPEAIEIIRQLVAVNKNKKWNDDLSRLYTKKKSWKRTLFEESLDLLASESVCINALKHDPELLARHKDQIEAMQFNNTVNLSFFLCKIRLYWSDSLAQEWKKSYLERLEQSKSHKAVLSGLCRLLPKEELNKLLKQYAPTETKIDWHDVDQDKLGLCKEVAKIAHLARPLASIEEILPYAKGDYLQFAVPSVSSILSQLSANKCRTIIPSLIDAPVSLQKFGIRCAFDKLNTEALKPFLNELWTSTKNSSIRTIIFIQTFTMLTKESNEANAKLLWQILSVFIDTLTPDENNSVYKKLGAIYQVPDCVKAQFFMKSYKFLNSLPARCNCRDIAREVLYAVPDIMSSFDDDFVMNVILKDVSEAITGENCIYSKARLISSFILSSHDEDMQIRRYQKSLAPLLKRFLPLWDNMRDGRIKNNLKTIYNKVFNDIDIYTFEKKMHIPVKTFEIMQRELESSLSYQNEYVFLTTWKLATAFVKILNQYSHVITESERGDEKEMTPEEKDKMYKETHEHVAPHFIEQCVQYLREDLKKFGPTTYILFASAFSKLLRELLGGVLTSVAHRLLYCKYLLQYHYVMEAWLVVALFLKEEEEYDIRSDTSKEMLKEMRQIVSLHASVEVKMHFCELFEKVPDTSEPEGSKS